MSTRRWALLGALIGIGVLARPATGLPVQAQQDTAPTTQDTVATTQDTEGPPPAAVTVRGQTLFYVQEKVLSFSPEDRAQAIATRVERLYRDPLGARDSITVVEGDGATDIVAGDLVIMSVTDRDAAAAGRTRVELATEYAAAMRRTVQTLRSQYSITQILLGALYTLLTLAGIVLFFVLLGKLFPKLYAKFDSWRDTRIPSLRIQRFTLLSASRVTDGLILLMRGARVVLALLAFYFAVPLILGFFPWTRTYARIVFNYIMTPLKAVASGFTGYLPNLFYIAVIVVITYYLIKFIKLIFTEIGRGTITIRGFYKEWARPTYKIVRFLVLAFTGIAVFPYLPGADSAAFKGVSIFLGVLFSLGSSSAIANVVAGVVLTYTKAFELGDRVKISDTVGDVIDRTLLATHVRTTKNVDITIPNAMVMGSHIINYSTSARTGLILHTSVTIGYDVPWRRVHELLIAAAIATEGIEAEPAPFVLQTSLDDNYVSYELNAYTDKPRVMTKTYSELHQNIQDSFAEAGVEIMSPHYSAIRDGNQVALPADSLPKGYKPPAFRVTAFPNPGTQS
jgi:small-conductance mechanosensitive channel